MADQGMSGRKWIQERAKNARRFASDQRAQNETLDRYADKVERGAKTVSEQGKRLVDEASAKATGVVDRISLGQYRSELDAALDEALEVVAAQAAEIEVLRRRLAALEGDTA